ncbi:MAG TPA: PIN domain-containing protein [Chthonomonadaceae bacterium]|nr:PIN domain-containing protein [Chthonomonadaceae bacterium]
MNQVFADTLYWIATIVSGDPWHEATLRAKAALGPVHIVTTEEVLTEFLTALARRGEFLRRKAAVTVRTILADETATVLPQTHFSFMRGLEFYESRADKGYSLVDCISMNAMREVGITAILTNDHHFMQEGFTVLIHRT